MSSQPISRDSNYIIPQFEFKFSFKLPLFRKGRPILQRDGLERIVDSATGGGFKHITVVKLLKFMNKNNKKEGKLRVGIIVGGTPEELNDAICTAHEISKAIEDSGNHVEIITFDDRFEKAIKYARLDMVFIIDATYLGKGKTKKGLRDILERLKIPYTSSKSKTASITKNKILSKKYFEKKGLLTPAYVEVNNKSVATLKKSLIIHNIKPPYVIKPRDEGAGIDVSFIKAINKLSNVAKNLLKRYNNLIVEQYIEGIEITVPVLEIKGKAVALAAVEIEKKVRVLSNDVKALLQFSPQKIAEKIVKYHVPARISTVLSDKAMRSAIAAHEVIRCRGYSRVDIIIDKANNIFVLEINSLPVLSESGLFSKAAKLKGLDYKDIIKHIMQSAFDSQ